jgi:hypothetical protein
MTHSAPVSTTERVVAELDAALPFIPRDVHRLTAEYARMIGADFDLDTCLMALPCKADHRHSWHKPAVPEPSTAALHSAAAQPATIVTLRAGGLSNGDMAVVVGRQTFRQSGLRRFAIRLGPKGHVWSSIGVTVHTPAEAVEALPLLRANSSTLSDAKTALHTICGYGSAFNGQSVAHTPVDPLPQPPKGCAALLPLWAYSGRNSVPTGHIVTCQIDAERNSFAVQLHAPYDERSGVARRSFHFTPSNEHKCSPMTPANSRVLTPSEVSCCPLPSSLNILDCRPCLTVMSGATVSEVEPSDGFPLWAPVIEPAAAAANSTCTVM